MTMRTKNTPHTRRGKGGRSLLTKALAIGSSLALAVGLGACSGSSDGPSNTITYWLWDSAQQPGYQQCAAAFSQKNPGLKVSIQQYGWGDYWQKLTAGFISGTGPDVFTDHLSKFADFSSLDVIEPLGNLEATKNLDPDQYQEGLAALWKGEDGKQYGVPKDWDTVGLFYNEDMLKDAGVTPQELSTATWNPKDGGSYEKIIAKLTIDKTGKRGDQEGFNPKAVKVYGMAQNGGGGAMGQTSYSAFAFSNGWKNPADRNPWGDKLNYGDPALVDTMDWLARMVKKGYAPPLSVTAGGNFGANQQFAAKQAAISQDGSWMISTYQSFKDLKWKVAPTPVGPSGKRASMFNGLADSINAQSKNKENAAKWVAFMGSRDCQDLIAKAGVVFPAQKESTKLSVETREKAGVNVDAFMVQVTDKTTHLAPVTRRPNRIDKAVSPVMEEILLGQRPASSLTTENQKFNSILERGY